MGLNIRLKGYVYRQHLYAFREMVLVLQRCRWKFSHKETYSIELEFYSQKRQICFLSHSLGELGVTYALLQLVEKPVVDFLFATVELFR